MIVESIVTTRSQTGQVNYAPMGVEWGTEVLVLKPFLDTATYGNLLETRAAVVNLTDDVGVFVRAAIGNPAESTFPAVVVDGVVLEGGCSWSEVEVVEVDSIVRMLLSDCRLVYLDGLSVERLGLGVPAEVPQQAGESVEAGSIVWMRQTESRLYHLHRLTNERLGLGRPAHILQKDS